MSGGNKKKSFWNFFSKTFFKWKWIEKGEFSLSYTHCFRLAASFRCLCFLLCFDPFIQYLNFTGLFFWLKNYLLLSSKTKTQKLIILGGLFSVPLGGFNTILCVCKFLTVNGAKKNMCTQKCLIIHLKHESEKKIIFKQFWMSSGRFSVS